MKNRIYKIKNKNLVTGNPNEVTENEILVKENNDGTVELSHRNNGTLETLGSGGNGGGSKSSSIIYFNANNIDLFKEQYLYSMGFLFKIDNTNNNVPKIDIVSGYDAADAKFFSDFKERYKLYAVAVDFNTEVKKNVILKDYLISVGIYDDIMEIPQITKEEFYDLTVPTE
jgi:hypothetical protein